MKSSERTRALGIFVFVESRSSSRPAHSSRAQETSMGDQAGATLQNYNSELVSVRCSGCVAALCAQRAHPCAAFVLGSA